MAKKFKSRKKRTRIKISLVLVIFVISFAISLSYFSSLFQQEEILHFLLKSTIKSEDIIYKTSSGVLDFLLQYTIGTQELEDNYDGSTSPQEYISDPDPAENKSEPIIYLYNTHQGEEYKGDIVMEHNIVPTVMLVSYRLREKLNEVGLDTVVETNPISDVLKVNAWDYSQSYQASRLLMEKARENYPTLKYYFDLHRDAISYDASIISYQNKDYAKVLFVIGTKHDAWQGNYELALLFQKKLEEKIPGITRGISKKEGYGVNGIYNQDFSRQTLLFEIGGQYNKISEVNNTILVLVSVMKEVIG